MAAAEIAAAYALVWMPAARRVHGSWTAAAVGAAVALVVGELTLVTVSMASGAPSLAILIAAHVVNLATLLALAWQERWPYVAPAAVIPAWLATIAWQERHPRPAEWRGSIVLTSALYAVFAAYPFVLDRRARESRDPHLAAVAGSFFFFFAARAALVQGELS